MSEGGGAPVPRGKSHESLELIDAASEILAEIQPASVRAVCYKLFTRGLIPSMSKSETNKVSRLLARAREEGCIPWEWIVDETREPERPNTWANPKEFAAAAQRSFRRDRWQHQPVYIEVWSEKGTVRGILAPVLKQYAVTFRVFHGYASATSVYGVAQESQEQENPFIALYVGDWDPSGLHMSEIDLPTRLEQYDGCIEMQRIALCEADLPTLERFDLDDKLKDPRSQWYYKTSAHRHGPYCWELDALDPRELRSRVESSISAEIDWDAWDRDGRAEAAEQESLRIVLAGWNSISRPASKYESDE